MGNREGRAETRGSGNTFWPLLVGLALLWATLAVWLGLSLRQTQRHFTYINDDPYIHMAMAKNLAEHGVWGVTEHGFTSTSSSPLWTLILSLAFFLFGPQVWAPLVLNALFATASCVLVWYLLKRHGLSPGWQLAALVCLQAFIPLTATVFCGQEHTLHLLLTLGFAAAANNLLMAEKPGRGGVAVLLVLAALVVAARYEGLFLVFVAGILFAARKRPWLGVMLVVSGFVPVIAYGLVSVSNGWFFLPNPVLLKGNAPYFGSLAGAARFLAWGVRLAAQKPHLLVPLLAALALLWYRAGRTRWEQNSLLLLFIGSALLHLQFGRTAPFSRYEGYLVGFGVFALAMTGAGVLSELYNNARKSKLKLATAVLTTALAIAPLAASGLFGLNDLPVASRNIYEQQFQVARFVREFYQGKTVALSDIGAVNYFADITCIDLWGLADMETGKAIAARRHTSDLLADVVRKGKADIAVIYDRWFDQRVSGGVPPAWTKVGEWTIRGNVICGDPTVSFYAVDPSGYDQLVSNLRAFASQLPPGVIQSGPYVAAATDRPVDSGAETEGGQQP